MPETCKETKFGCCEGKYTIFSDFLIFSGFKILLNIFVLPFQMEFQRLKARKIRDARRHCVRAVCSDAVHRTVKLKHKEKIMKVRERNHFTQLRMRIFGNFTFFNFN